MRTCDYGLRVLFIISLVGISHLLLPSSASAEVTLCIKKSVRVANNKLVGRKAFRAVQGSCPRGFIQILNALSAASLQEKIQAVDGIGSGIDADRLDGLSSEAFASAEGLNALSEALTTASANATALGVRADQTDDAVTTLTQRIESAEVDVVSLESNLTAAESTLSTLDSRVATVETRTAVARVVQVATSGGNFTNIASAIASLASPSSANPYLVLVAPGTYTLSSQLIVPAGVTIRGAGKFSTILTGDMSNNSAHLAAVVRLNPGAKLEELRVVNTATSSNFGVGVSVFGGSATEPADISAVTSEISSVLIEASGSGSLTNIGLQASTASVVVRNSIVRAINAPNNNRAVSLSTQTAPSAAKAFFFNSHLVAGSAGTSSLALLVTSFTGTQSAEVKNSTLESASRGIEFSVDSGTLIVSESSISAPTQGIVVNSGAGTTARIRNTFINSADNLGLTSGGVLCNFISTPDGSSFAESCE